ncbi:metal ABC transporter ATP-binding protein [Candidatus Acetothermia bacterium]|nr:metal ABC transporter ATP-binding protein [Candidatus Acetothermia bacterium]MCI2431284.1 metal ABC transporter ATP-binding protein [Candidatus Acetothermia bacterium]MCI2436259.1 metal ABC transporter ATP-binding protein [Candidatus Acetothermia bacterium]
MCIAIVEIENLSFGYGAEPVLENLSLSVQRGALLGLIGPNGGGKTTLLKLVLGLLPAPSGRIRLFGQPLESFKERAKIGYVRQRALSLEQRFPVTVEEMVSLGRSPRLSRWRPWSSEDTRAVRAAMRAVEIEELRSRSVWELSGGQQQRVFLARVLAQEPELLLLDEPTTAVDPKAEAEFYMLLEKLNREHGLTVILVSHDIETIAQQVTKIACLNKRLLYYGVPEECAHPLLEELYAGKRVLHHGHGWTISPSLLLSQPSPGLRPPSPSQGEGTG